MTTTAPNKNGTINPLLAKARKHLAIILALVLGMMNTGLVVFVVYKISELDTRINQINPPQRQASNINFSNRTIELNYFLNHPSVIEIGAKLKVEKNSISTNQSPNCKTPVLPPIENGCQILMSPSKLLIPGMRLTSVQLEGQILENNEIHLEKIPFDKVENPRVLGIISSNDNRPIPLSQSFGPQEVLRLRMWNKSQSDIELSKIIFTYVDFDSLRPVILDTTKPLEAAIIYMDVDKDKKYDQQKDLIWTCQQDFPGIKLEKRANTTLIKRNDACMQASTKPESWLSDEGQNALPIGSWLINLNDGKPPIPFEVRDDQNVIQF